MNIYKCMAKDYGGDVDDGSLAYDLRQRYAKLVGDHLEDVAYYRKTQDYINWFNGLDDLYTISKHKFKNTKKSPDNYNNLKIELIRLANVYPNAWNGTGSNSMEVGKITNKLKEIEMYLYSKMDEASMFGTKRGDEGL